VSEFLVADAIFHYISTSRRCNFSIPVYWHLLWLPCKNLSLFFVVNIPHRRASVCVMEMKWRWFSKTKLMDFVLGLLKLFENTTWIWFLWTRIQLTSSLLMWNVCTCCLLWRNVFFFYHWLGWFYSHICCVAF